MFRRMMERSRPFLCESPSSAIWLRGFGDWNQVIDPGFSGRIEAAVFREPREQAFASFPPAFHFGLNTGQSEFGKMQLQRFQHAHQNRATLRPAKCFRGAAGFAVQSSRAKRSFGFVVGTFHFRMQHKRKQFFIAHQSRDFLHEIVELMLRLAGPIERPTIETRNATAT